MKCTLFAAILAAFAATAAFADRTANREWVGRNFAPSNLVPRVEALENAEPSTETDPMFGAWKEDIQITAGKDSSVSEEGVAIGEGTYAGRLSIAIGPGARSNYSGGVGVGNNACASKDYGVAIGSYARAIQLGAVQIGQGNNLEQNTLQFRDWQIIDSNGKIPVERLPEVTFTETDPVFSAWTNSSPLALGSKAYAGSRGTVAIGPEAQSRYDRSVALGAQAIATAKQSVQLGGGSNGVQRTLQFLSWQLVDADGKIPKERLPELEVEEADPDFIAWINGRRVVAGVSDKHPYVIPASATEDFTIALGGMATNMYCIAIGDKALAGAMRSVAIGDGAEVLASSSVQLGQGKCETKGTLQFRFTPILTETKKSIDGKKTYIGTLNEKLVIPQLDAAISNLTARIEALEARIPEGGTE